MESSKVNLRYIFELDTTDRDLSLYDIHIVCQLKFPRSNDVIRSFQDDIDIVYSGYYSNEELITKDNTAYVVYTLTNIPYRYWDYDFDVNCVITSEDEFDSSDAENNILSVLVEENNELIHFDFEFEQENDECILTELKTINENLTIPERTIVTEIDEYNRSYSYYKEVTGIGANLLQNNTTVRTVTIPDCVKTIGANAFDGCTNLIKVIIPNSVTTIEANAFANCNSLDEIVLSKNLTSIGENAFEDKAYTIYYGGKISEKRKLASDTFNNENDNWYFKTYDESTIDSKGNHWYYRWNNGYEIVAKTYHEVTLSFSTTEEKIYKYVADNEPVYLDNYVELEDRYFIGWYVNNELFDNESIITSDITIDAKWVYASISLDDEIGYELYDLQSLNIETIDLQRFNHIKKVTSISTTNDYYGNGDTVNVILPDSIKKISDNAFKNFKNIKNVYYTGTIESWLNIKFEGIYANPSSSNLFESFYIRENEDSDYEKLTTIEIPNNTLKIGDYQFFNMKQIDTLILPENIDIIGNSAFGAYNQEMYNTENNSIINKVYYYGNSFKKNDIRIVNGNYYEYNQNNQFEGLYNRLSTETKWYCYKNNVYVELPGDYWWFDENRNIVSNTYFEIVIHLPNDYDDMGQPYIRALNSDFDIELNDYTLYYDKAYNQEYSPTTITSSLELYARRNTGNVIYTLSDDGYYYIVTGVDSNVAEVVIPRKYNDKPVQKIAANAFRDNTIITSISLTNYIDEIGAYAFEGCTNLYTVYWDYSFNEWTSIDFITMSSNPMIYANEFMILNTIFDGYKTFNTYTKLENPILSNDTKTNYPFVKMMQIKDHSLFGFNTIIFRNINTTPTIDTNTISAVALTESIKKIYLFDFDIDKEESKRFYNELKKKIDGTSIDIYRYTDNFSIIDSYSFNYYNPDEFIDYSGYWFNISNNQMENQFNEIKYYKVIIDNQIQYIREGAYIRDIEIPDGITVSFYIMVNDERVLFDITAPVYSDYEIFVEATGEPTFNPEPSVEEYTITFASYSQNLINVDSKNIIIKSGKTIYLVGNKVYIENIYITDLCYDEYEIENIYTDEYYNELFDINTPITNNITLYPKYIYKLNYGLIYDHMYNRYAYTVYLNNSNGYSHSSIIIPSTYKGLPVISISMNPNGYTTTTTHYQNLVISEGIREINSYAFKNVEVENLVIPTTLNYFKKNAFGETNDNTAYNEYNGNSSVSNVYYEGKLANWLNINFENEYSNPIYLSKRLYLYKRYNNIHNNSDYSAYYNYDYSRYDFSHYCEYYELLTTINRNTILGDNDNYYGYDNTLEIGKYDFINLESLTNIDFSQYNEITFSDFAFKGCNNLSSIIFNNNDYYDNRIYINKYAFDGQRIDTLKLGKHMFIDSYAFNNCFISNLIMIINNEYIIRSEAFNECIIDKVYYKNETNNDWFNLNTYISSNNTKLYNAEWYRYNKNPDVPGKYWYYNDNNNNEIVEYNCGKIIIRCNYGFEDIQIVFNKNDYNGDNYSRYNLETMVNNHIGNYYKLDDLYKNSTYQDVYSDFEYTYNNDTEIIIYAKIVPNLEYESRWDGYYIIGLNEWSNLPVPVYDVYGNITNEMNLVIPEYYHGAPVVGIGYEAFRGSSIRRVVLSNKINTIESYAFYESSIMEIKLSNSLKTIGDYAFARSNISGAYSGYWLPYIKLPNTLIEIGDYAFAETDIHEIVLPNSLEILGKGAFKNCRNLERVYNRSAITRILDETFAIEDGYYNNFYNVIIEISDKVTIIDKDAFKNNNARLVIYSKNVTFNEDAFGDNDEYYYKVRELYIYPNEFTSNINVLSSKFRIFNYSSEYEEKRIGFWWHFDSFRDFDRMYYDIFTRINM